jgi:integrase
MSKPMQFSRESAFRLPATLLLLQGVPVKVVSEMLGHANVAITMNLYMHVLPTMQRAAADAMEVLFQRGLQSELQSNG